MSLEPGGVDRTCSRRTLSFLAGPPVCGGAGCRGDRRGDRSVRDREWKARILARRRLRGERLWCAFAGRVFAWRRPGRRDRADDDVRVRDPGGDRRSRATGIRAAGNRTGADTDPPCRDPRDQPLGQSCPEHRPGADRGRVGARPALDVLGRADRWGRPRRRRVWVGRTHPTERVEPGLRPAPVGPVDKH